MNFERMVKTAIAAALVTAMPLVAEMKCAPGKCGAAMTESKDAAAHQTQKQERCVVCGMALSMYPKTRYEATVDGKKQAYCSIHCVRAQIREGKHLEHIKVTDAQTMQMIDAEKAYFVITPTMRGTMSSVSKLAFASKEAAEAFAKAHGGKVVSFEEALKEADKDFASAH